MSKNKLTEQDILEITKAIENNTEIPEDLLPKLNPSFFEKLAEDAKFDYQKLDKYKIPTIEYSGKRPEALILSQAGLLGGGSPLQVERCFDGITQKNKSQLEIFEESKDKTDWKNLIVQGDNLQFLKTCYLNQDPLIKDKVKGKVKLIYIDPPFGTGDEYGASNGVMSYTAKIAGAEFMEVMRDRLIFMREILSNDGFIFVRIDYHFGHYLKILLDDIFGIENFRNEIILRRSGIPQREMYDRFNPYHDNLFLYSKRPTSKINPLTKPRPTSRIKWLDMHIHKENKDSHYIVIDGEKLVAPKTRHFPSQSYVDFLKSEGRLRVIDKEYVDVFGNKQYKMPQYLMKDYDIVDSNWTDIPGYSRSTNYPTENSEEVLQRVIESGSNENDIVIDFFAGSGTTAAVAEKLGRRWIMCDFGKHAIYTMQKRLLEIANSKKLGGDVKNDEKYNKNPNPFCVVSVGAYDFQRIMNLRENKEAYIKFVLSLFGITDIDDKYSEKYKLTNIYAQKDGNPVEVYPIWEDEYLKEVKIDEDYLNGIIQQYRGNLKGKYYIIAPETCDVIGDTKIGNAEFVLLTFPYKILEEASRNFQLTEQPSSPDNINDLVSSVGFYFNEDVEIDVERSKDGLKIVRFMSTILDNEGNHYEGLEGLAMILIDKDYDGTTFRMEEAVYLKDIKEDGTIETKGLTEKVAIIAIDKHGNESKIIEV